MGSVQEMLRGEESFRKTERRFKKGDTAAPEAELERKKMREEELKRLEGEPKKARPPVKIFGREETGWREDYKKKEIEWPQKIRTEYGFQMTEEYHDSLEMDLRRVEDRINFLYREEKKVNEGLDRLDRYGRDWLDLNNSSTSQQREATERLKAKISSELENLSKKRDLLSAKIKNYKKVFDELVEKALLARYKKVGEEGKKESAAKILADEIDAASGRMSQEERRRVGKMDKESRVPFGPLKEFNEEEGKWFKIKSGERPVKKPKYKTEPEKLRSPKQVGQQGEEKREGTENEERQAA